MLKLVLSVSFVLVFQSTARTILQETNKIRVKNDLVLSIYLFVNYLQV